MKKWLLFLLVLFVTTGLTFAQTAKKEILVVYECNMELERLSGRFTPGTDTVYVRGAFNGWGTTSMMEPSTLNPDIYTYTAVDSAAAGDTLGGYKFFYTPGVWEGGGDRRPIVTEDAYTEGVLIESRSFNDGSLETVTGQDTEILFIVNTTGAKSAVDNSDLTAETVHVFGNTAPLQWPDLGWPDAQVSRGIELKDDGLNGDAVAGDKIFSGKATFPAYTSLTVEYKFGINFGLAGKNGGGNDNENGVGANHILTMTPSMKSATIATTFGVMDEFEMTDVVKQTKELSIIYECNMEIERLSGRFNPASDTVYVRGAFNGWGTTSMMEPSTLNPDIYTYTTVDTVAAGDTLGGYKFFYTPGNWEGGSDRRPVVTSSAFNAGYLLESRTYNDGSLETITSAPTTILLVVDTKGAISAVDNSALTAQTVHAFGNTAPLQWPDLGWPDAQITRGIELKDDGLNGDLAAGDQIFSGKVTFPAYTGFNIEYKYGINYGIAGANGGGNDNENGVGANHILTLTKDMTSATLKTTFGNMTAFELVDVVTDIEEEINSLPVAYTLEQNYPNPFNPATTIKFSIPENGMVSLRIYNMLGQEVATLVNEEMNMGTYNVTFDASKLSSGIYFYTLNTNNFSSTKKMILMK